MDSGINVYKRIFLALELNYAVAQKSTKPSEQRKFDEDFKDLLVVVQSGVDVLDECFFECLILAVEHNQHVKGEDTGLRDV